MERSQQGGATVIYIKEHYKYNKNMKTRHNAIHMLVMIILCLCFGVNGARAQDVIDVTGSIKVVNKVAGENNKVQIDTVAQYVYYGILPNMNEATRVKNELNKLKNVGMSKEAFREKCKNLGVGITASGNGSFEDKALPGMVILAVTMEGDVSEDSKGNVPASNVITAGKSYYKIEITTHNLNFSGIRGKKRRKKGTPFVTGDGTVMFPISFTLPKDSVKKSTRIVVQPYAIGCDVEDTMSYLLPIIYEGDNYHSLQDKRMSFDYFSKDRLGHSYRSTVLDGFQDIDPEKNKKEKLNRNYLKLDSIRQKLVPSKNDSIVLTRLDTVILDSAENEYVFNAMIKYILPDKKKMCRGPFVCALEDYHHVYYKKSYPGTCLANRPFKFLDFTAGVPEMELHPDFQEEAKTQVQNVSENLNLRFVVGRAELVQDSINELEAAKMAETLRDQEGLVPSSVKILATASPDGGEKINRDLAQRRANVARQHLAQYLRGISPKTETKVYTWDEVADMLTAEGRNIEAQTVRDVIAANGNNNNAVFAALKKLDIYEPVIVPVLDKMRAMSYSYFFIKKRVLTATEVVQVYHDFKQDYISGKNNFSSGDYYNLYANITDTLELDTITMLAYRMLEKKRSNLSALYSERIAPYVLNRVARKLLDNGTPDTLLLKPFIDEPVSDTIFDKELDLKRRMLDVPEVCINYQDILITQAMNYYQLQMFPRAHKYIEWIKAMAKKTPPAALSKIQMYMDLMTYFQNDEDNPKFVAAKDSILNSSPDNKAILYTEVPEWGASFDERNNLLDLMDDDNPKKWYLKGMLWASRANDAFLEPKYDLTRFDQSKGSFRILSQIEETKLMNENYAEWEEYDKKKTEYQAQKKNATDTEAVDITGIKHYLAYFHHCFQLGGPSFRKYYFYEGRVEEELRKKYLYLKKDFPAYEKLFTLLKARDDENRSFLLTERHNREKSNKVGTKTEPVNAGGAAVTNKTENPTTPAPENKEEETKE